MGQFCKHGREVWCPRCNEESPMHDFDVVGSQSPKTVHDPNADKKMDMGIDTSLLSEDMALAWKGLMFQALFTEYRNFVLVGADKKADSFFKDTKEHHKALGAVGLAGEGGEVLDLWKKQFFHTKEPENYRDKVLKELGDVMWYLILKAAAEEITIDEIIHENMRKLVLRYPERHPELIAKFTDKA